MRVIGLISGTSHDAIEAAAVDFELAGDEIRARVVATSSTPYANSKRSITSTDHTRASPTPDRSRRSLSPSPIQTNYP